MGVVKKNFNPWPNCIVPFKCTDQWAISRIDEFNKVIGKTIFLPIGQSYREYYVNIMAGSHHSSFIGMDKGKKNQGQDLIYEQNSRYSIFHEMGHCLGLGHEYFHIGIRRHLLDQLSGMHLTAFNSSVNDFESKGNYDENSIMSYRLQTLGVDLNIKEKGLPDKLSIGDIRTIKLIYHL